MSNKLLPLEIIRHGPSRVRELAGTFLLNGTFLNGPELTLP